MTGRPRARRAVAAGLLAASLAPAGAWAAGFTEYGYDILADPEARAALDGRLRLRTAMLHNLDLDRGTTPSGERLFPVPLADPEAQTLYATDLRLRTDLALYAPGAVVAVKARLDLLDNLPLGGSADGIPGGSVSQDPPGAPVAVRRLYGEAITPVGALAAGRMGHHVGLGMLANGGDCADCDTGDAADRVAFVTPLLGHLLGVAYDLSSTGYLVPTPDGTRQVESEPSAAVRTASAAWMRWHTDWARRRRRAAGKTTVDYGLWYAYRWQQRDVPATWLPVDDPPEVDAAQVVARGLTAHATDAWLRVTHPRFDLEVEGAWIHAAVEHASAIPGVRLAGGIEADQLGAAARTTFGAPESRLRAGLDAGWASGDPAPGFGARSPLQTLAAPRPGDLEGAQAAPPGDHRVDNFRFHPDYRVDRILFRELVGTVTDAVYVRPHARWRLLDLGRGRLDASVAVIASWADEPASTPSGHRALGVEIDPTLSYESDDGFTAALEYALLLPGPALDNPDQGLDAGAAQLLRAHLSFGF